MGGVLFIAGPRVTYKKMMRRKFATMAVLHCRFGSRPIKVVGTYWPIKNLTGAGSLWNRMLEDDTNDNINPIVLVKSHITVLCSESQGNSDQELQLGCGKGGCIQPIGYYANRGTAALHYSCRAAIHVTPQIYPSWHETGLLIGGRPS